MNTTTTPTGARERRPAPVPVAGFAVVTLLWLAFGAAPAVNPGALDDAWRTASGLWWPAQAALWVLFLPWMLGLAIWQVPWSPWLRLLLGAGLALATLFAFFPRAAGVGETGRRLA